MNVEENVSGHDHIDCELKLLNAQWTALHKEMTERSRSLLARAKEIGAAVGLDGRTWVRRLPSAQLSE